MERRERSVGADCGSRITEECGVVWLGGEQAVNTAEPI